MRSVVLDASAVLAWLLPTQATDAANAFLEQSDATTFEAPAIFDWEVRNVLLTYERRGLSTVERYDRAVANYLALNVTLHPLIVDMDGLAALAQKARLSLFDASYLALALEQDWPLASRDEALLIVAARSGVKCFDLRATT